MGRYAHECATVVELSDGRVVVYSGDDHNDECMYKFVGSESGQLVMGGLFVANFERGEWVSLDRSKSGILQSQFSTQEEVLTYCREAAKMVGGTPLDRPEDIEIDPISGDVFVSLTNNKKRNNFYGSILRLSPAEGDHEALSFSWSTYATGGKESGFACPDNLVFDKAGNLWFTTDISGSSIEKGPYEGLGNNGLFVFPRDAQDGDPIIEVAKAPSGAEFTGPCFSPDFKTLFLSVQHPGEGSDPENPSTRWPEGGSAPPKSAVIMIAGSWLDNFQR